ncbi:hypothetical protein C472_04158 [Halorubrum tebenquichense DSM 14210]|uniref:Uncharacterized protein n=1 Tax=Halorubrum tebenquichense DSM 14210 TaxID=1227485 RepID=M0DVE9_9EURY|nr:hypothetical protein C472_04158 [Halorubrum tebenquichense DSM 14210]
MLELVFAAVECFPFSLWNPRSVVRHSQFDFTDISVDGCGDYDFRVLAIIVFERVLDHVPNG